MICRMCMVETPNLISIFKNETSPLNRAAVITQHFGFVPMEDDPITNMICISCWTQIECFHTYYVNVGEAQRRYAKLSAECKIKVDNIAYDDIDQKQDVLVDLGCVNVGQISEESYAQLNNITPSIHEENKCKTENVEPVDDGDEEVDNDDDDLDDSYEPPPEYDDSDSNESTDEEDKPISQIKQEVRKRLQDQSTADRTGEAKRDSPIQIKTEEECRTKPQPKKRGRKKKSETQTPIQTSPHTAEYRKKSKEYDEEIAKRTKLKCDLCEKEFTVFNILQRHYRTEHKIKGYVVCCTTKFYKRGMFLDHIMKHLEPDRLRCDICKKTYCSRRALQDHILVYHNPADVKTFQCDICPRKYLKQYQLNIHKKKHVPKEAIHKCEECGKGFNTPSALQTHRRYIHENKYAHMCHICAKVLRSRTLYLKHQLVEHEGYVEPKQQCEECGAWLKNAFRLKLHMKKHKERESEFICTLCGKSSPSSTALQSHIKYVHETQRQFQCTFCDKSFKRAITLTEHLTTHTGDVLYTCPHCPKTFNSRANMHSHRKKKHPIEWEEARRIRGAPLKAFGKISNATGEDHLDDNVHSINEESEMDVDYDCMAI